MPSVTVCWASRISWKRLFCLCALKPDLRVCLREKTPDELRGRLWVLLHQPVGRGWDDGARDIVGDELHEQLHHRSAGRFTAEGKDRDRELSLFKERPVVDRILREGGELREASSHRSRRCVESCVVLTHLLAERARVRGKVVPEVVEVDAFSARHEPLHVRTAETEVPRLGVVGDLLPGPDARQRRLHRDPPCDAVAMLGDECEADEAAHVVGDKSRLLDPGDPFVVTELLAGRTLEGILSARRELPTPDVVRLGLQLCSALHTAHGRGVVHRDIKPTNLLIVRDSGGNEQSKLIDFGIAAFVAEHEAPEREERTKPGALGSPEYMAPEQLLVPEQTAHTADIYSVGVVLFECLTGRPPFEGTVQQIAYKLLSQKAPSIRALRPDVSADLCFAIERALAKDPGDRYQSSAAFSFALTRAAGDLRTGLRLLGTTGGAESPARAPRAGAIKEHAVDVSPEQRRRFPRAPYITLVRIVRANGATLDGRTEDISQGGALVCAISGCEEGERVEVRFALPTTGRIVTSFAVARWHRRSRGGGALGLEFEHLPTSTADAIAQYVSLMSDSVA